MTLPGILQVVLYLAALLALGRPLGHYVARVYAGDPTWTERILGPLERLFYRACRIRPHEEMDWSTYAISLLTFNMMGLALVYLVLRLQGSLPWNPQKLPGVDPGLAFNTAVSFATNTNWQAYGGETTLSYGSQMLGLTVQNFLSAATGMAVLVALARGLARRTAATIGNFWTDLVRGTVYVLLPLSLVLALLLVSQGAVQTFSPSVQATTVEHARAAGDDSAGRQVLALGPAASQIAIKQLGTNGGGFFNANSAHPFENPTPFSNFLEMISILLLPASLCFTLGRMVGDERQGRALLAAMMVILVLALGLCLFAEQAGNPALARAGADQASGPRQGGGNMEGKEVRFGIANSALWAVTTTAASNGSVNCMHDSLTPLGGLGPLVLMELGEVVFGGVGSGLYGMLVFAIITVFVAGLMVGRTPEYLGKKIESFEIKMASLVILLPAAGVLLGTAVASVTRNGLASVGNPGPHGFSEILYAFSSAANNNGSAFAGLNADTTFYNIGLAVVMLVGRFWLIVPVLAMAGSLARKKSVPAGPGTLASHSPLFVGFLVGVVLLVGALTFLPALALGPVAEQLGLRP